MSLIKLETILKRPSQPQEALGEDRWISVEEQLGTKLPADYKDFIQTFGTDTIDRFLVILNPFSSNRYVNLRERGRDELEAYAISKQKFPKYYVHQVYPQKGGILPFGATDNGEIIYWKTKGSPEQWPVVAYESRGPKYFEFAGSMTSFLTAVLTRTIQCDVFPRQFPSATPVFTAVRMPGA